jgi:hypothetical protein
MVLQISGVDLDRKSAKNQPKPLAIAISLLLTIPFSFGSIAQAEEMGIELNLDQSLPEFYIGVDNQSILTRGIYAGLANPNYNRLTFLFAHREEDPLTNHFHGIGAYSYSGLVSNPEIIPTNTNSRIPETYTGLRPIALIPGIGVFQNSFVSSANGEEYSNLLMRPVATINDSSELGEQTLFNSSGGRWNQSLGGAEISLQLVAISEGLTITNDLGTTILENVGDTYAIGSGDDFSFLPKFVASRSGKYSATFKLLDPSGSWGESGIFNLDFETVPEPSTVIGLILFGSMLFTRLSRKN